MQSTAGGAEQPREGDRQPAETTGCLSGGVSDRKKRETSYNQRQQEATGRPDHDDPRKSGLPQQFKGGKSHQLTLRPLFAGCTCRDGGRSAREGRAEDEGLHLHH